MKSGLGRRSIVRRDEAAWVRVERVRLGLVTRTVFSFFDTEQRRLGLSFIPWRPKLVRAALEYSGWPIRAERLDLTGRHDEP